MTLGIVASQRFRTHSVLFDDEYLHRTTAPVGSTLNKLGIFSLWFAKNSTGTLVQLAKNDGGAVDIRFDTDDKLYVQMKNFSFVDKLLMNTAATFGVSSTVHQVLASWDLANGVEHLYIDDVSDKVVTTNANDTIRYTANNWGNFVNNNPFSSTRFLGDAAHFYFNTEEYLDFSVEANRRKFRTANGKPAWLGKDGALPTGTAPQIYYHNPAASFATNRGTGGAWTLTGTLTDGANFPGA